MVALRDDDQRRNEDERRRVRRARVHVRLRAIGIDTPELVRDEALPEHADYRDTGCELSPSCLRCPLPRCKYDDTATSRQVATAARDREIALLRRKYRAPVYMLMQTYGLSRRSIFRIVREAGVGDGGRRSEVGM
jgi:hypothetical protein